MLVLGNVEFSVVPKVALPKTNIAAKNRPFMAFPKKESKQLVSQPSIFRCYVSFREDMTWS